MCRVLLKKFRVPKENPSEFDLIVLLHVYTHDYFLIITSSNRLATLYRADLGLREVLVPWPLAY